ncbi:hypothetical protein ACFL2V_13045 [Pseudomonadota bacterium]
MINKEVGSQPEIGESQAERIYILPQVGRDDSGNLGIFILPDGNNRSKAVHGTDYNDGGRNIVRIAEALAERNDVSVMVGSILSPENIAKRSDSFFRELYAAFVGLGVSIETKGTLVDANIKLEIHGDTGVLLQRGGYAARLAYMMNAVCARTAHLEEPSLRLILGVNYDEDTAMDLGCNIILRSGMESEDAIRLSGTRSHEGIANYGSTKLWPEITAEDVYSVIDDYKRAFAVKVSDVFQLGYSPAFIIDVLRTQSGNDITDPFDATITACASEHELRSALIDFYNRNEGAANAVRTVLKSKNGDTVSEFGPSDTNKTVTVLLGSRPRIDEDSPYTSVLAPGQLSGPFKLPSFPQVGYANVQRCPATPDGIVEGIRQAINFTRSHTFLKGAERQIDQESPSHDVTEIPEFSLYESLSELIQGKEDVSAEELAARPEANVEAVDNFNAVADVFVAKLLPWAREKGLPLEHDFQYRAVMNYFLTSFFLLYYPDHPNWQDFQETWEMDASQLAKYMGIVYLTDESIFDIELEDESQEDRRERLRASSDYIQRVILEGRLEAGSPPDVLQREVLETIARSWEEFIAHAETIAHPMLLGKWKASLANLYQCHVNEWELLSIKNPLVDQLAIDSESATIQIREKYFPSLPASVAATMEMDLEKAQSSGLATQNEGRYNLYLNTYLADINDSIGAGLAYRTVALNVSADDLDEESLELIDTICTLSNNAFRIANDLSDFMSRDADDSDNKFDSFHIMREKYSFSMPEAEATMQAVIDLRQRCEIMEQEIAENVVKLGNKCPKVALAVMRSVIARDIYKEGHYRTITRENMTNLFSRRRKAGIV